MQQSNQIESLKPFVKWVGGKSSSVNRLLELMPEHIDTYVEPFVGSGALFFAVNFKKAIINDVNEELINTYKVIKDNVGALEFFLSSLIYDKQLYDTIRAWDRDPHYKNRPKEDRAGRFIYLMKTCFNGLYRVNKKGFFNTPFGKYTSPLICDTKTLNACSKYLNEHEVTILNGDYQKILSYLNQDCFVYLDPPYYPISKTANFTQFQKENFKEDSQYQLFEFCKELHKRGIKFMLSNSDVPEIRNLYQDFDIHVIEVSRKVNSNTAKRNAVNELAIINYDKDSGEILSS